MGETMSFTEAMARARADHVQVESFRQPGNDYRPEHLCSCGAFVSDTQWDKHVLNAAHSFREKGRPLHSYPEDPRYRRSGNRHPQPGDIALCGHAKNTPGHPELAHTPATCAGCRDLKSVVEVLHREFAKWITLHPAAEDFNWFAAARMVLSSIHEPGGDVA